MLLVGWGGSTRGVVKAAGPCDLHSLALVMAVMGLCCVDAAGRLLVTTARQLINSSAVCQLQVASIGVCRLLRSVHACMARTLPHMQQWSGTLAA